MSNNRRPTSRRRLLAGAGSIAVLGAAGCLDDGEPGESTDDSSDDDDEQTDDPDDGEFDDDLVDDPVDDADHEVDVSELLVYDRDGEQVANSHAGHWHYETETGGLPAIEPGSAIELEAVFTKDGEELPLGEDEPYRLGVELEDGEDEIVDIDADPATVSISGEQAGETATVFELLEDGDVVWEAPPIDTFVKE
ncbi:aspartic acid-rich protein [Natronococcus amylolyticus DSM 10524]|uniref:Aspartic acid-rich protein n=1 Tax=Natronococcus amylolyticus DSM 10524 TaxID=1227497 RepID=L9XI69_9EURY|nr:hypothetical protein [Natronococcus amylolyticus]ELY61410.1 aspartic acid-rich protein [Natronococcus amylolyticus DSM 10524]